MKIVYCILDCSSPGGTDRTLLIQASYFAEKGHEVHIVTTEKPMRDIPFYKHSNKIIFHNLRINYKETDYSCSPVMIAKTIAKAHKHKKKLSNLLYSIKPDYTFTMFGHEFSFLYKIKDGSKKISEFHFSRNYRNIECQLNSSSFIDKSFALFKSWRKRKLINHYDAFTVLTFEDAQTWKGVKNLHVIPNALPFVPENATNCSEKKIISVGRLALQKGYDLLIEAWKIVAALHPDWTLDIYGSGEDYEKIQFLINKYQLNNSVTINPPTNDIINKYIESSIYVMSSRFEGLPMVLIEAMSCGLPCVSFACPCGPSEIIRDNEDGYVVPFGDIDGLASRICLLIENEWIRKEMGLMARKNIMRFSVENVMKKWESLFNDLKFNDKNI